VGTDTTAHLDKGALIVTYCDGIRCNGSLSHRWIGGDGTRWLVRLLVIRTRFDFSKSGRTELAHAIRW
jgi:hypothetical protein